MQHTCDLVQQQLAKQRQQREVFFVLQTDVVDCIGY